MLPKFFHQVLKFCLEGGDAAWEAAAALDGGAAGCGTGAGCTDAEAGCADAIVGVESGSPVETADRDRKDGLEVVSDVGSQPLV